MDFVNPHALLLYLVELDATEERWRMQSGKQLSDLLREQGHLDPARPQEYPELGFMLWTLKQDGAIRYADRAAEWLPNGRGDPHHAGFTLDDVWKFENIEVTREGRFAAKPERATVEINIGTLDIVALLGQMERQVDQLPLSEDVKADSKSKMHAAASVLGEIAQSVVADTLAAVLRQTGHLP
ncbi:MAG TPA: hypothetical protein VHD91_12190 [Gaiellaceae bacterium]|jgi:hypothetical protein|nr:hypothetical protein [Gaiellaceae bacterium]